MINIKTWNFSAISTFCCGRCSYCFRPTATVSPVCLVWSGRGRWMMFFRRIQQLAASSSSTGSSRLVFFRRCDIDNQLTLRAVGFLSNMWSRYIDAIAVQLLSPVPQRAGDVLSGLAKVSNISWLFHLWHLLAPPGGIVILQVCWFVRSLVRWYCCYSFSAVNTAVWRRSVLCKHFVVDLPCHVSVATVKILVYLLTSILRWCNKLQFNLLLIV